jgi:hypothetical protein
MDGWGEGGVRRDSGWVGGGGGSGEEGDGRMG